MTDSTQARADELFQDHLSRLHASTDRLFGYLMVCQFAGAIVWAVLASPRTWSGASSVVHPHVLTAVFLGGLVAAPTCAAAHWWAGRPATRYIISVSQMLMSGLLIHVSGGRIETHFHVFGSLAFLAFYRDWRVLIPPTVIVLIDHVLRGIYLPSSVYGVSSGAEWRFLEHAGWVVFENIILVAACVRGTRELRIIADRQAELEGTYREVEAKVARRTAQLTRAEKRKGAILTFALDGIVSMTPDGVIVEFNPAAERIFCLDASAASGRLLSDLIASGSRDELRHCLDQASSGAEGSQNRRFEAVGVRNGEEFPVELTITAVRLDDSSILTAFVRDLTDRRRLETELAHAQKMENIGRLAAGIAHEINTPNQYIGDNIRFVGDSLAGITTAIAGYRDLHDAAREGTVPAGMVERLDETLKETDIEYLLDETPKAVGQALEGAERVASIVRAMKEFSHPGQESQTMIDMNAVLKSTVTVARNEWKYVATVEMDLEPNLPQVNGHPGELGQVILNLIVNSVHAIKERYGSDRLGVIRIKSERTDNSILVSISDNGSGIPEDIRHRLFDPFFTTKGVGLGTGQGLAISRTVIVERHSGDLRFESTLGEGATFFISLPMEGSQKELAA